MNETEIRERLFDLAADAPKRLTAPPQLLRRARRRVGITLASLAVFVLALGLGGIASVRWLADSAGEPAVRPTPTPVKQSPAPDSRALRKFRQDGEVLTSGGGFGRDLVAVNPDTGRSRTLVDGAEIQGRIGNAAWSSDGRWLAYQGFSQELWVMSAQGEPRPLTQDVGLGAWAWSPAGAQLATLGDELILLDPSTGRATDLGANVGDVGDPLLDTGPVWSPDGTRIAYAVPGLLYSVDVKTGDRSVLVRLPDMAIDGIDWSPDGAHLAIVANAPGPVPHLYLMNADGSGLRLVDENSGRSWGVPFSDPSSTTAWSPDGTQLAYADFSGPDDRELRIWTVSLHEPTPSLVASHTNDVCCQDGGSPVWSPDGSQIAFETENGHLVVNADGTGDLSEIDELTYLSWGGGWYFCFCYG